tara:strand:+ start:662 stop:1039 length:378 start_codon:yes stop_codon:yes gene_type:complete
MNLKNSNRNFGILFSVIFFIIGITNLETNYLFKSLFFLSFVVFVISIFKPDSLSFLNKFWIKFGLLLGKIISPIVMYLIYFLAIYPVSLLLKLFKKEIVEIKYDPNKKTYWSNSSYKEGSMDDQF